MAINVTYQVPASLLQQQRQAERRAYKRQVNLMTMQQNFQREQTEANRQFQRETMQTAYDRQREQTEANRQFQRETMQTAYDRQREKTADERTYQQELLAHKEGREDALRKQAMELADKQRMRQEIQQAETMLWQDSERRRQALEKDYNYSSSQQAELKQLDADEREAHEQKMQGVITPEQYLEALSKIRQQKSAIMPDTPKRPEETMSVEEKLKASTWTDPKGNCWYFNKNGEPEIVMPPKGSVSERLVTAKGNAILEAAKSCIAKETGVINKETYQFLKKELEANFATGDEPAEQPKFFVPQTGPDYVIQNKGGGNPLQQMMGAMGGQQQPMQEPMSPEQQDELAANVEAEAKQENADEKMHYSQVHWTQARRLRSLKERRQQLEDVLKQREKDESEGHYYLYGKFKKNGKFMTKKDMQDELKQINVEIAKIYRGEYNPKQKAEEESPKPQPKMVEIAKSRPKEEPKKEEPKKEEPKKEEPKKEEPKKEEPKRQTTSVTFNGISDINGLKAWVNGKRLAVGDEMPGGGKITDLDFDNGTLTYELDGKKYTIRKSRNAQNI